MTNRKLEYKVTAQNKAQAKPVLELKNLSRHGVMLLTSPFVKAKSLG